MLSGSHIFLIQSHVDLDPDFLFVLLILLLKEYWVALIITALSQASVAQEAGFSIEKYPSCVCFLVRYLVKTNIYLNFGPCLNGSIVGMLFFIF